MERNNFLRFLILWVTLSTGFAFPPEDSSEHLLRRRRVIDRTPNANTRVRLQDVPYVVNIQKNDLPVCAGSILTSQIILTTFNCIQEHAIYTIISGTISAISGGRIHHVTGILRNPQRVPPLATHEIALLLVSPPISFGENINRPIPIFHSNNGQLPAGIPVTVSGYGATYLSNRRLSETNELRSIRLPTISLQECLERNDNIPVITNEIICTSHANKSCSPDEFGNPLVFDGYLVGVLVRDGFRREADLYLNVATPKNRVWILSHLSPENIPTYVPPPASPPARHHRHPYACSKVHPCNDDD